MRLWIAIPQQIYKHDYSVLCVVCQSVGQQGKLSNFGRAQPHPRICHQPAGSSTKLPLWPFLGNQSYILLQFKLHMDGRQSRVLRTTPGKWESSDSQLLIRCTCIREPAKGRHRDVCPHVLRCRLGLLTVSQHKKQLIIPESCFDLQIFFS